MIPVSLAGATTMWRFVDSEALSQWVGTQPWLSSGGIARASVTGPRQAALIVRALEGWVRVSDAGASDVRIAELTAELSVGDALRAHFELERDASERDALESLASALSYAPRVFVCAALTPELAAMRGAEARGLGSALSNLGANLTLLLLARERRGESWSLLHGAPAEVAIERSVGGRHGRWRAYLHRRVAWETAGDLDRALSWDLELGLDRLPVGDDAAVERALNRQATVELGAHDPSSVLAACGTRDPGSEFLWRPDANAGLRPVPWAARALLLAGATEARPVLRGCLVNGHLFRTAIAWCHDLEWRVRERHFDALPEAPDAESARAAFAQFQAGSHFDCQLYPPGVSSRANRRLGFQRTGPLPRLGLDGNGRAALAGQAEAAAEWAVPRPLRELEDVRDIG